MPFGGKCNTTGKCPDLGEWWLHKGFLKLQNLYIYICSTVSIGFLVDMHFVLCKVDSIFIPADILVLVSELVVVVILSE